MSNSKNVASTKMERAKEAPSLTTLLLLLLTMALGSYAIATDNIQPAQDGDGRIAWPHESVHYFLRRNPSGYRTTLAMEEEHNPKIRDYWMKNASFAEVVRRRDDVDLPSRHVGGVVYDGSFEIDLPEGMQVCNVGLNNQDILSQCKFFLRTNSSQRESKALTLTLVTVPRTT